jgi:hypothetical protein
VTNPRENFGLKRIKTAHCVDFKCTITANKKYTYTTKT